MNILQYTIINELEVPDFCYTNTAQKAASTKIHFFIINVNVNRLVNIITMIVYNWICRNVNKVHTWISSLHILVYKCTPSLLLYDDFLVHNLKVRQYFYLAMIIHLVYVVIITSMNILKSDIFTFKFLKCLLYKNILIRQVYSEL